MILAVDAGSPGHREAEHLALTAVEVLGPHPPDLRLSTHPVRVGVPHAGFALSWGDPSWSAELVRGALPAGAGVVVSAGGAGAPVTAGDTADGALVVLALRTLGREGRLVRFPGCERLRGTLPVGSVTAVSAVDEVVLAGGGSLPPDTPLDTRDWVRPVWRAGAVVLPVERAAGGVVVPAEKRHQRACCAAH